MTRNGHLDLAALPIEKRVKALRDALGWTQKELAAEIGINVRSVKRWEAGQVPSEDLAYEIAAVAPRKLNAKPELFFEPKEAREERLLALERKVELLERRLRKAGL
jgi:transcriptional regulator with XRE-family HTH domain